MKPLDSFARPRRMREMRTFAIDDPVAWASVSQTVSLSVYHADELCKNG